MRPVATDGLASSVGIGLVCVPLTTVSPAKMAEPIKIPFGIWTQVDPRNYVSDGGPDPPWKGALLREMALGFFHMHHSQWPWHWDFPTCFLPAF